MVRMSRCRDAPRRDRPPAGCGRRLRLRLLVLVAVGRGRRRHDGGLRARPALARAPRRPGEILIRAEATPKTAGPFTFAGTYRVRFVQYAPEDPRLDFAGETPFVAALTRADGSTVRRLFRAAAASGSRTVRLSGRYLVDASFGDYPFALRFTRVAG